MAKYIVYLKRADGADEAGFEDYYLGEHAKEVLAYPGVEHYIANVSQEIPAILTPECGFGNPGSGVDAVDEIWMDAEPDLARLYGDGKLEVVGAYETDENVVMECEGREDWPLGQRSPKYKRLAFLRRKDDITHDEFIDYWVQKHGPLAKKLHAAGTDRYVQNMIRRTLVKDPFTDSEWDGIVQMHFDTPEHFANGFFAAVPNAREIMLEDVANFIASWGEKRPAFLFDEYIMR